MTKIETDYLVVGAGAVGLTVADTLIAETDATLTIVDRRAAPGGHWNDAYPFVRLHGPSAIYGVNSEPLGADRVDASGLNAGLMELATGEEILAYFGKVMRERLLPSGRVTYLPLHSWTGSAVRSISTGEETAIQVRRKLVDTTVSDTRLPSTHPPAYAVAPGVRCVPPNALVEVDPANAYVVIGAGKTAIDTVLHLLDRGVGADTITWIRPRDPWLLNRKGVQPSAAFFDQTIGMFADEMEAARDAASIPDLFERLEAAGCLLRIDPDVTPTMFRCGIVSEAELLRLRSVGDVVRLGRVRALEPGRIVLEGGDVTTPSGAVHVDCSAEGIPHVEPQPVFRPGVITPQYVRRCQPAFSAAFVAHLEAALPDDDDLKNGLCAPIPAPREPLDWLRMHLAQAKNRAAWAQVAGLDDWVGGSRLDGYTAMTAQVMRHPTPDQLALFQRFRGAVPAGLARLGELLAEANAATPKPD